MKQEPISCRADNALAARWACVLKRPILYLAVYIDNNEVFAIRRGLFSVFSRELVQLPKSVGCTY